MTARLVVTGQERRPFQLATRLAMTAGFLRESVVLSCASWCQLQRAPLGKLLKLQARFPKYRTHNAGVEGSSPSLSTM
jgi:hypothetical protein